MLGVSRVTIWRMTKEYVLHPVEILPGSWHYRLRELLELSHTGISGGAGTGRQSERSAV